ncbi:VCBS domain-containing protein [Enterovirga aerilata]|uniref:Cadherin domain-containing protein n=1 Tax=Enterovirga aerilata TaxID=2730920 RepID=A0A849I720_9HYPH|nr:VCBS domain-containing protein [Enterovirga sp. DB1703]NNM73178.1 hypothetical protein [Enterovirga sp. DB1703]
MLREDLASRGLDLSLATAKPLREMEIEAGSAATIRIPDAHLMFQGEYRREGFDLVIEDEANRIVLNDYFRAAKRATLESPQGARLTEDVVAALTIDEHGLRYAQATPPQGQAAIGRVETVAGQATAIRNGTPVVLNQGDLVFRGDVVQTDRSSSLGINFVDGSTFSLGAGARMVLNEMVYQPGGTQNSALINIVQGSVTFLAGQVAKSGEMRVGTPVATMGIRGTLVNAEINAENGQTRFSVLREPNGEIGRYDLIRDGRVIATVSAVDQVTVVSPTGIVTTEPKTFQQQQAEELLVQQVFQIFSIGQANPLLPGTGPTGPGPGGGGGGGAGGGSSTDPSLNGGSSATPPNGIELVPSPQAPPVSNPPPTPPSQSPVPDLGGGAGGTGGGSGPNLASKTFDVRPAEVIAGTGDDLLGAGAAASGQRVVFVRVAGGQDIAVAAGDEPTLVSGPYGTLGIRPDGSYSYVALRAEALAQGEHGLESFTITVQDAEGRLSTATVTFDITGENEAPTVAGALSASLAEGPGTGTIDLLAGASDIDNGAVLHVENLSWTGGPDGAPPPGVSLSPDGRTLLIDFANPAFDSLAAGQPQTFVLTYEVVDEFGARVAQTVTVTVTGTNDAPVISGAIARSVTENSGTATILLTAFASDPDQGAVLRAANFSWSGGSGLPPGFSQAQDGVTLLVDTDHPGLSYLAEGVSETFVLTYDVVDEHGASARQTATVTVTGTNDAPVVSGPVSGSATEDTGAASFLLTAFASDVDEGAVLRATNLSWSGGTGLPPGFTLAADGLTLLVDTNDPGLSYLADGQTETFVLDYTVVDEHGAGVAQTATIVVTGTNDPPTIAISQPTNPVRETNDDDQAPQNVTSASATVTLGDPDGTPSYDLSGWQFSSSTFQYYKVGTYGTAFLNTSTGVVTYQLNDGDPDTMALVDGDVVYDTFTITATDGSASTSADVSFEVQGTTDGFDGGFESGYVGWFTSGNAQIANGDGFPEGTHAAQIATTSNVSYQSIASFLGIPDSAVASNPSSTNTSSTATVGSAMKTIGLHLDAGQQFIFDYKFSTSDYSPYNDFAFFSVDELDQVVELSDIEAVGDYGQTGWVTFRFTASSSGVYHFGLGVMDTGDDAVVSTLLVDRVAIETAPTIVSDRVLTNLTGTFEIPTAALLFNDLVANGTSSTFSVIGTSPGSAASLSGDHVTVTSGSTTFTYEAADDGTRASDTAGVTLASNLANSGTIAADSGGSILIASDTETALQGGSGVDVFVLQGLPTGSGSYDLAHLNLVGSEDAVDITFLLRSGQFAQPASGSFAQLVSDSGHYDLQLARADGTGYETVAELYNASYSSSATFHVIWDDHVVQAYFVV